MLCFDEGVRDFLAYSLLSCGGEIGPYHGLATSILSKKAISPKEERIARYVLCLDSEVEIVSLDAVLHKFGSIQHFQEMREQVETGCVSVAWEVPGEIRPFLHTFLPIEAGKYTNGPVSIAIDGLIPLGPQEGSLVAHLGAVFSCPCGKKEIEELKAKQAQSREFLSSATELARFSYEGTTLQDITRKAKEKHNI